ncbi:MAG: hypothetical protein WCO71_14070, partial [Pseudomonadota bacterium]
MARKLLPLLLILAASCSIKHTKKTEVGGTGGPNAPGPNLPNATEPLELTGDKAKAFDDWQASLTKSCDTSSAFSGKTVVGDSGIDGRRFFEKTGGSLALGGGGGAFALLGLPRGPIGQSTSTSSMSETASVNGVAKTFSANATLDGSHCKIEINGKLAYETEIWASLPVLVFGEGVVVKPVKGYLQATQEAASAYEGVLAIFGAAAVARE